MSRDALLVLPLPDGTCAAFDPAALAAARQLAVELGFSNKAAEPNAPAAERLLTSKELATLTGVGDTTLESMAARKEIPSLRLGKALRFCASDVLAVLKSK